ncbi:MAG: transposase [Arcticibacter sp.]
MYLFAIIDVHSRKIIGWSLSNTMTVEWSRDTLLEAIAEHGTPEIFNTDQGSQFTSPTFIQALLDNGIRISMDGKGRALDNVFIERFWRSLKQEYLPEPAQWWYGIIRRSKKVCNVLQHPTKTQEPQSSYTRRNLLSK